MRKFLMPLIIGSMTLTGCISTNSYVDPKFSSLDYSSVAPVSGEANVTVEFQRNGKPFKGAQGLAEKAVFSAFEKAGYTLVESDTDGPAITVVVNNVADVNKAVGQGVGTGLTLGLAGTAVTDYYEIAASYTDAGVTFEKSYDHAIYSTIGNKKAPIADVVATKPQAAFDAVVEDVILQFLLDVQAVQAGEPIAARVFRPRAA